jgi:hypothetical protein
MMLWGKWAGSANEVKSSLSDLAAMILSGKSCCPTRSPIRVHYGVEEAKRGFLSSLGNQ